MELSRSKAMAANITKKIKGGHVIPWVSDHMKRIAKMKKFNVLKDKDGAFTRRQLTIYRDGSEPGIED